MVKKPSKAQKAKLRKAGGIDAESSRGGKAGRGRGRGKGAAGVGRPGRSHLLPPDQQALFESRKKTVQMEESAFSKLSPPVLERLNLLASYAKLSRPVAPDVIQFDYSRFGRARAEYHAKRLLVEESRVQSQTAHPLKGWLNGKSVPDEETSSSSEDEAVEDDITGPEESGELRLPRRPKWRSDMDSKAVHSQEEEVFRQWLHQTDTVVERAFFTSSPLFAGLTSHTRSDDKSAFQSDTAAGMGGARMVSGIASQDSVDTLLSHCPAPGTSVIGSLYERNIEVYRQLWRVCERSDLVCVLADARCPLLHLPPSLIGFLERYMRLKVVIVLTKADIVPPSIVEAWKTYLKSRFPSWEVVGTESYAKMERFEGQGSRTRFTPLLSADSRKDLFKALRKAHRDLITPPPHIREDAEKAKNWVPPCATDTDWDGVEKRVQMHIDGTEEEDGAVPKPEEVDAAPVQDAKALPSRKAEGKREPMPYITIGLIGQPNVGKSSLLNALFGAKVVRASKTPGKTKHFQTHFLVPPTSASTLNRPKASGEEARRGQIRLCDSPGLVFPSLIGMEMQVMGAVLAISQVQAITSCIRFVAEHIALEQVLSLDYPHEDDMLPGELGKSQASSDGQKQEWTATQILEAVAKRYMFKTAKANRWDVNRAGNLVMRAVAEGRIKWAFRPPGPIADSHGETGKGIWIADSVFAPNAPVSESTYEDILAAPNPDDDEDHADAVEDNHSDDHDDPEKEMRKVRFEAYDGTSDDDSGEEDSEDHAVKASTSIFSALAVEDANDEDEDEDEETDGSLSA